MRWAVMRTQHWRCRKQSASTRRTSSNRLIQPMSWTWRRTLECWAASEHTWRITGSSHCLCLGPVNWHWLNNVEARFLQHKMITVMLIASSRTKLDSALHFSMTESICVKKLMKGMPTLWKKFPPLQFGTLFQGFSSLSLYSVLTQSQKASISTIIISALQLYLITASSGCFSQLAGHSISAREFFQYRLLTEWFLKMLYISTY